MVGERRSCWGDQKIVEKDGTPGAYNLGERIRLAEATFSASCAAAKGNLFGAQKIPFKKGSTRRKMPQTQDFPVVDRTESEPWFFRRKGSDTNERDFCTVLLSKRWRT
jgi:hypothetical protein